MQDHSLKLKPTDSEIVEQVLNGYVDAFESLLKKYGVSIVKIIKRHVPRNDVEEITQEVFARAYQSLPAFKGKGNLKAWLSTIAIRTCYDYWRKAYRTLEVPMSSLTEKHVEWLEGVTSEQSEQSLHEKGLRDEARELLDWALSNLSAEDKMVIELIYLEGLSGKEAADLLGWSVANVKVRSFRSRKKLQKLLRKFAER